MKNTRWKSIVEYVTHGGMMFFILSAMIIAPRIAFGQLPGIKIPGLSDKIAKLIRKAPAITTGIEDAVYEDPSMDNFNPTTFSPLVHMPRTSDGGFLLMAGTYDIEAQSYCLRAGTHAPRAGGPGYIYAPLRGDRSEIMEHILARSWSHPEIEQEGIQGLIWAIVARTDLKEMSQEHQQIAAALLTKQELKELGRGVIGSISDELFETIVEDLPEPVQQVLEAERNIRKALTSGEDVAYEELEGYAILPGIEPAELLVREIPKGRWSKHPDGYFVRFFPKGYSHTRIEVYVPESAIRTGNPHNHYAQAGAPSFVAIPGNTGAQRLGMSPRKVQDIENQIGKTRAATNALSFLGATSPGTELPGAGISYILDFNYRWWGHSIKRLSGDPPRSDYTQYEQPRFYDMSSVKLQAGLSKSRTDAIKKLLESVSRITAYLRATAITQDRLGGALKANDMAWASEQARVYVYYKRQAGLAMLKFADHYEKLIDIMQKEGQSFEEVYITAQMASAYKSKLRNQGFPAKDLQLAQALGYSKEELDEVRQDLLALDSDEVEGYYLEKLQELIASLRKLGASWKLLPEVTADWMK